MSGVLCVMTPGELMMLLWCVDSWDTPLKVKLSPRHGVRLQPQKSPKLSPKY